MYGSTSDFVVEQPSKVEEGGGVAHDLLRLADDVTPVYLLLPAQAQAAGVRATLSEENRCK